MAVARVLRGTSRNVETPQRALSRDATPNSAFFVRDHFDEPEIDPVNYRLWIGETRWFSLSDLRRLPQHRVTCVLECAGNGRNRMVPRPKGIEWGDNAVGCATWEGPALRDVLRLVAPPKGTVEVVFQGADSGPEGGDFRHFERSLPIDVATGEGPILALRMNGKPLPVSHGAPVRLIVPGWYAVASVKWLMEIRYIDHPFTGYYQAKGYVWDDGSPVREVRPRGILTRPNPNVPARAGATRLEGRAWAGAGLAGVEVRVDDGAWLAARLGRSPGIHAWVPWSLETTLPEGSHRVRVRARDSIGRTQPLDPVWNRLGYGYNTSEENHVRVDARWPRITSAIRIRRKAPAIGQSLSSQDPDSQKGVA